VSGATAPDKRRSLGDLLRHLRCQCGLTRRQVGALAQLPDSVIRLIEIGRFRPTRLQVERLLLVPQMTWAALLLLCEHEGIALDLAPEPNGDTNRSGATEPGGGT